MPVEKKVKKPRKFPSMNEKYPVLYEIDGVKIRRVNLVSIYIPEHTMVKIAKALKGTTLSIAKILSWSSKPCSSCKNEPVVIDDHGKSISIPRGLMFVSKKNSGTPKQKKKK